MHLGCPLWLSKCGHYSVCNTTFLTVVLQKYVISEDFILQILESVRPAFLFVGWISLNVSIIKMCMLCFRRGEPWWCIKDWIYLVLKYAILSLSTWMRKWPRTLWKSGASCPLSFRHLNTRSPMIAMKITKCSTYTDIGLAFFTAQFWLFGGWSPYRIRSSLWRAAFSAALTKGRDNCRAMFAINLILRVKG